MSATSLEKTKTQGISLPVDGIILAVASRFGSKAKEVERFLKFAMVGTLGAIIDLGTSFLLQVTVLNPLDTFQFNLAATISFVAAVMSNFIWNRYWTYPDSRTRPLIQQLGQFGLVSLSGWLGRTVWLNFSKPIFSEYATNFAHLSIFEGLAIDDKMAALIGAMTAIFIGIFVVMIWNFFINRYWTYNDVDKAKRA